MIQIKNYLKSKGVNADLHIINGQVQSNINIIDGGENAIYELFPENDVNYIDGGVDAIRNYNIENRENYLDGGSDTI